MSRLIAILALTFLLGPTLSHAQTVTLRGRFVDAVTKSPVPGVQVKLTGFRDSTQVFHATATDSGAFVVKDLPPHGYRFEATRIGYAPLRMPMRVQGPDQDAGLLALTPESIEVGGVSVTESPAPATQKGDTTEYRAGAVKTSKDATAEELVQKLPGVTMENGQVKAQGENVQQVLVNGKPFFGSDPAAAMRNLPADVVDRIQVYDRMSDQAEFSGFDDNQSQKTMNFILRDQKARFGKVYGGYGDQDRYQSGGNLSVVRGGTRVTLIGMSNNINQKNFSPQDLFGAMGGAGGGGGGPRFQMFGGGGGGGGGRGPGGGGGMFRMGGFGGGGFDPGNFLVGQQSGVSTTHSGGVNYVGQWGRKLTVSASLFANASDTDNAQILTRQYVPPQDSLAWYNQLSTTDTRGGNQRFDGRFEWTPDSLNSVIFQPRLYFQNSDASTRGDAANQTLEGSPLSAARSVSADQIDGDNLSGRLTLRHRFARRGRNVSADLNAGHSQRDGEGSQNSLTESFDADSTIRDTLDQQYDSETITNSYSARIALTEPISKRIQMQAIYNPSITLSDADSRTHRLDPGTGAYTVLDSVLSSTHESRHTIQNAGIATLYTRGAWKLLFNATGQRARLESDETFPGTTDVDRTFDNFLPSINLTGNFSNRRSLRLAWTTSTSAPTIGQLQSVVNNSNPLSLSSGNPDLRPTYAQSLSLRWSEADPLKSKSRFGFLNVTRTAHPIANSTVTAANDTTIAGIFLARGVQLTRPVNLDVAWNANLFGVLSRPLAPFKSILSLNGGGTFSRTPTRLGGAINIADIYALRAGLVLSSNISPRVDFTLSYQGTYNISRNTLSEIDRGDYYTQNSGLRFNLVVGPGIVFRQEVNYSLQTGVPSIYGQNLVLWNSSVGKKLLKDERGELRLTTSDVLEQNRSVNRSVTESYIQDSRDRTLSRYLQAVFTYTFK